MYVVTVILIYIKKYQHAVVQINSCKNKRVNSKNKKLHHYYRCSRVVVQLHYYRCRRTQWKNVCACPRAWVQKRIIWRQNGGTLTAILRDYKTQIVAMPISSVRMIFCANNDRCVPKPKVL